MSPTIAERPLLSPALAAALEHPVLRQIYTRRRLRDADELQLDVDKLLKPEQMQGMEAATDLLLDMLHNQGRILVVSDFDADGATSCALAIAALRAMGFRQLDYIVPNRFRFGYGLTPEIVALALQRQPDLIITVDNGISSLEGVAVARAAGVRVLVTDHHLAGATLPNADAIINPNQPGCGFPSKALAGVGVIFYLMLALRARLRAAGWFADRGIAEPNLADCLDLVALGTVADVVPLDYNNRILVSEGLKRIRAGRCRPGILALIDAANRARHNLQAADLGFALGPRLNAAGRLDDMSLGIECLLTSDPSAAHRMALELDALNSDRKLIEADMREQAFAALQSLQLDEQTLPAGLCVYDASWHQGVIGILASRIKDHYHRPVIVFANAGDSGGKADELKGSARSLAGYHIRDALDTIATRNPGLISKFGGHAMAAGLSIARADLPRFTEAFAAHAEAQLDDESRQARILTDGPLDPQYLTLPTAELLQAAGPWGQGFPEPRFDGEFRLLEQRLVGDKHLKLKVMPADGGQPLDAIAFNIDTGLWPRSDVHRVRLVYRLDINEYRGVRALQLMVEHLGAAGSSWE
ncbi:MAG: hypothetical protein RLZZ385_231 [Pseudomonadota bacterium]|jgi:single-stranded-DNA-specific exonuclease